MASNSSNTRPGASRRLRRALAWAAAIGLPGAAGGSELVVDIYVDRPTVLAFVPASPRVDAETDAPLARALAAQALASTEACLGRRPAMYQLLVADRIVVHDGARLADFDISGTAPLTGLVLAAPSTNASVLFAGGGPAALAAVAPGAAARFFHLACGE